MSKVRNVVQRLQQADGDRKTLGKGAMTLTDGVANEETIVATYEADVPFVVRDDIGSRIQFVTAEEFTTDGTAGNTETFSLGYNLVETKNTQNLILYDDGGRVQPDSINYSGDSFDYTDGATGSTLHAFYVARDPGSVRVEKQAPKTSSQISDDLTEDTTSGLSDRDQNKQPVEFEFTHPLDGVVPTNWKLNITVDAPAPVRWDDDNLTTTNGDEASNALVSIPIFQYEENIRNLEEAVKRQALGLQD